MDDVDYIFFKLTGFLNSILPEPGQLGAKLSKLASPTAYTNTQHIKWASISFQLLSVTFNPPQKSYIQYGNGKSGTRAWVFSRMLAYGRKELKKKRKKESRKDWKQKEVQQAGKNEVPTA